MVRLLLSVCFLIGNIGLFAQEQLGLKLENYAGVNAVLLNPAANATNPLSWDVNLGAAAFFFDNNYFFIENTSVLDLYQNRDGLQVTPAPDIDTEITIPENSYILDFFDNGQKRNVHLNATVTGPSAIVKLEGGHSIGFVSQARIMASTFKIPNTLSYYNYYNRAFNDSFAIDEFHAGVASWTEFGLTYANHFETYSGSMSIGGTLKYLNGYEAAFFENAADLRYTKLPGDTITSNQATINFGLTTGNLFQDNGFQLAKNGNGISADLGMMMTIDGDREKYLLRLGASVLDIGYINYTLNAQTHNVTAENTVILPGGEYTGASSLNELEQRIGQFSGDVLGDSTASLVGNSLRMLTPTSLVLQADYAVTDYIYINALISQRIARGGAAADRANLYAITPRFEHRWGSFSIPLVLYENHKPRVGVAARLGYLIIGSDNVFSLFGQRDQFTGTDIYVALKFNPFKISTNRGIRTKRKKGKVKCYEF